MKANIMILVALALLSACNTMGTTGGGTGSGGTGSGGSTGTAACTGSNGKDITIRYGDSRIDVTHKVNVNKADEKIVLKLQPENNPASGKDYKTLQIRIEGKTPDAGWLDRWVAHSDPADKKVFCVNTQNVGVYKYSVTVPGVGEIDPRVEVIDQ
jgi:hypothetical protein